MVKIVCYLAVTVHQPAALSSTSNQGFTFVQFKGALPTDAGIPRVSHPIVWSLPQHQLFSQFMAQVYNQGDTSFSLSEDTQDTKCTFR